MSVIIIHNRIIYVAIYVHFKNKNNTLNTKLTVDNVVKLKNNIVTVKYIPIAPIIIF